MKYKLIFTLLFLLVQKILLAQNPNIEWQKSYGGSGYDGPGSIEKTIDDGYILIGSTSSNDGDLKNVSGTGSIWVLKLDINGNIIWNRRYGGSSDEGGEIIHQTYDKGYIFLANTTSTDGNVSGNHGRRDIWVVKIDSVGMLKWQKCIGGSRDDGAFDLKICSDNGYMIGGYTESTDGDVSTAIKGGGSAWLIKLDSVGTIQWSRMYGNGGGNEIESIWPTTDKGYVIGSFDWIQGGDVSCANNGYEDFWIFKTDSAGNIQWQSCLGGSSLEHPTCIQQTTDKGYFIVGQTTSNDGDVTRYHFDWDYWAVKLDSTGKLQWEECLGGTNSDEFPISIQTSDKGYILAGESNSTDGDVNNPRGDYQAWIIKLDSLGNIQWNNSFGGSIGESATTIVQTLDNGYVFAAISSSKDGDVTLNNGLSDIWIVKLNSSTAVKNISSASNYSVYPNPVTDGLTVKSSSKLPGAIQLTDILGRQLYSSFYYGGEKTIVNLSAFSKGVYLLKITENNQTSVEKIIKE